MQKVFDRTQFFEYVKPRGRDLVVKDKRGMGKGLRKTRGGIVTPETVAERNMEHGQVVQIFSVGPLVEEEAPELKPGVWVIVPAYTIQPIKTEADDDESWLCSIDEIRAIIDPEWWEYREFEEAELRKPRVASA